MKFDLGNFLTIVSGIVIANLILMRIKNGQSS